ncbi:hypothetical protein F3K02_22225 [Hydrogenophaga sp. D2P1]|uniref:Uncharacterized protein n=1 Tax=Hydrogenophaga aromaticivorans TaxID=2610898 RepID=A0A7Y8H0T4_9BURK|nr:hypothetical protein [Hydrogenophaga aromaticivorans]NWF47948.1 hypothetical protein [Hydrogenophaga aromaticivorans]
MTSPYRQSIARFMNHFRGQLAQIDLVQSEQFRQTLYCLALDPFATAAYPKSGSRSGVVRLLRELSDWPDAMRVSRLQLRLALQVEGLAKGKLYREVQSHLRHQPIRHRAPLSTSPLASELVPYATVKQELKVLEMCTYSHLFYTFRSNLVHEFRPPGYQNDWGLDSVDPYYGKSAFDKHQLVFPVAFVSRIAHKSLEKLETYLLANKIAPHSKFAFGSLWRWH